MRLNNLGTNKAAWVSGAIYPFFRMSGQYHLQVVFFMI